MRLVELEHAEFHVGDDEFLEVGVGSGTLGHFEACGVVSKMKSER